MATLAHPSLTNSHVSHAWTEPLARALTTLRLWHNRIEQRRALSRLSPRDLADFGASSADVYREVHTPFWRAVPPC